MPASGEILYNSAMDFMRHVISADQTPLVKSSLGQRELYKS